MPDISGITALDVAIGLAFVYLLLSVVVTAITEAIASVFKLRAKELERGIRQLLVDPAKAKAFYENWRIRALFKPASRVFGERAPSYIPSRTFALTPRHGRPSIG